MRYHFEPVDLAVVSGALLTIFAAALLWISTQGSFHVTTPMQSSPDMAATSLEEEMGKTSLPLLSLRTDTPRTLRGLRRS
jgi:hypothetical protein